LNISRILRTLKSRIGPAPANDETWIEDFKKSAWTSKNAANRYTENVSESETLYYYVQTTLYVEKISSYLKPGERVLDVGCGTGVLTRALYDAGLQVSGMDISASMLEQLEQQLESRKIDLRVGDIFNIPFEDGTFDGLASRWVLPHFPDWPRAVAEMGCKVKPGGYVFFDFCNSRNVDLSREVGPLDTKSFGYCHDLQDKENRAYFYAVATRNELEAAAASAGLTLVEVRPSGFFVNNAAIAAALGGPGYTTYKDALKDYYQEPEVAAFLKWFERFITPKLPDAMVHGHTVVMQRPEA